MSPQHAFDQLMTEFNPCPADFYFLNLIPLIEIIWVNGENQPGELRIHYNFLIEHIVFLDRIASIQQSALKMPMLSLIALLITGLLPVCWQN
ncbi:hypothetical protein [Methylobacter luteus]|uniref:hypothetical protein n=1 Tax=Methylobacter luteus TaxID=415 RepID=UPI00041F103A|nr:hypothetical protein [Methylobacter luteus]